LYLETDLKKKRPILAR